jgi:uncharacterized protein
MKGMLPILRDGLILLIICTAFATSANFGFKTLRASGNKPADILVTAINQEDLESVKSLLGPEGMKEAGSQYKTIEDYQQARLTRADDQGRNPLMWLAYVNFQNPTAIARADTTRVPILDVLIQGKPDLNAKDKDGWTALMWASWSGMPRVAEKLLQAGASPSLVDRQGNSALMLATSRGNLEVVKVLLNGGADRTAVARNGKNAIGFAEEGLRIYPKKANNYRGILTLLKS